MRGSDRSIKSTKRDIDDIALSMHHLGGSQKLLPPTGSTTGYGRKDIDDMVRQKLQQPLPPSGSHAIFKRENSLQMDNGNQPHGIMLLAGDGLLMQQQQQQQRKLLQRLQNGLVVGTGIPDAVQVLVAQPVILP